MSLLTQFEIDHRDVPVTDFKPQPSTVFCQRVVQRGPTVDDPTLEVAYTVRRFTVTVCDFYKNRPEVQHD